MPDCAHSPGPMITIEMVMARLEGDDQPDLRRRREMLSALRTICRLLDADPAMVPAEPRNLRQRLATISPTVVGLTAGRWSNIRSLTMAALKRAGVQAMVGGPRQLLALPWEHLRARLIDRKFRIGLSRFMHFCSGQGIMPMEVDARTFERFAHALEHESLIDDPGTIYRRACLLWNEASKSIPGWPPVAVPVPNRSHRYAMAWSDFPPSFRVDAEAYLNYVGNPDPLADDYAKPLRPATIEGRRPQILQLATAIVRSGVPADRITDLLALVQPDNAKLALRFFLDRKGGQKTETLHQYAILLRGIARLRTKRDDPAREALNVLCRNLAFTRNGMTQKNRGRLRQFDDAANVDALLSLPQRLLQRVQASDKGGRRDAMRVMYAVAIELLIVAPMRIKNLTALEHERHLVRTRIGSDATVHLVIPAEEMKNSEAYEMALPPSSAALLALYLREYRPRLANWQCPWLFPGYSGRRRHSEAFSRDLAELVFVETGIRMHVHLFRHLAVKLHLNAHPEDIETARRILGHRSLKTTLRAYAEVNTAASFRRYDDTVASLRERARNRLSRPGRVKHYRDAAQPEGTA
jgi:integrase